MKVSRRGSAVVYVYFVPTRLCNQICSLNFKDETHGEFTIDIAATVALPKPSETIKFSAPDKRLVIKDLQFAPRNTALDRTRAHMLELLGKEAGARFFKDVAEAAPLTYKAHYTNNSMRGPTEVLLGPQGPVGRGSKGVAVGGEVDTGKQAAHRGTATANTLSLQLECRGPGQYSGEVVLRSKMDVRVVTVVCNVVPRDVEVQLTFASPIRQSLSQEIPISNKSLTEWTVHARITIAGQDEDNAPREKVFRGQSEIKIPAGQTKSYVLSFHPSRIERTEGILLLNNATTNDSYTYNLTGAGEEPSAEEHYAIECNARQGIVFPIQVGNFAGLGEIGATSGNPWSYSVKTDLRCITGPATFHIPHKGSVEYGLSVLCAVGGDFYGTVTFTKNKPDGSADPLGDYFWYTLEVKANTPSPERSISVSAQVRNAVAMDIVVGNPMSDDVTFAVELVGEGLIGYRSICVAAGQSITYEAVYSPLVATGAEGAVGSISFVNQDIGLFWYRVDLLATPADPIDVPVVLCPVGTSGTVLLAVENPTDKPVTFHVNLDNPDFFFLDPSEDSANGARGGGGGGVGEGGGGGGFQRAASGGGGRGGRGGGQVEVAACSSRDIAVLYTPRSINKLEHGCVCVCVCVCCVCVCGCVLPVPAFLSLSLLLRVLSPFLPLSLFRHTLSLARSLTHTRMHTQTRIHCRCVTFSDATCGTWVYKVVGQGIPPAGIVATVCMSVAVCCSMLQRVAAYCSVLLHAGFFLASMRDKERESARRRDRACVRRQV